MPQKRLNYVSSGNLKSQKDHEYKVSLKNNIYYILS